MKVGSIKLFNADNNKYSEITSTVLIGEHMPSMIFSSAKEYLDTDELIAN